MAQTTDVIIVRSPLLADQLKRVYAQDPSVYVIHANPATYWSDKLQGFWDTEWHIVASAGELEWDIWSVMRKFLLGGNSANLHLYEMVDILRNGFLLDGEFY